MSSGALVDVKFFARFSFNKLSSSGSVPFSYNAMNTSVILLLLKKNNIDQVVELDDYLGGESASYTSDPSTIRQDSSNRQSFNGARVDRSEYRGG
jgi:hypothetical protein